MPGRHKKPIPEKEDNEPIKREKGRVVDREEARKLGQYGKGIHKRSYLFRKSLEYVGRKLRKDFNLPVELEPSTTLCLQKLSDIAYRDNKQPVTVDCPHCRKPVTLSYFDDSAITREKNSIQALAHIFDRLAPKLASLQVNMDIQHEAEKMSDVFFQAIVKYVPADKKQECLQYLNDQIEMLNAKRED